MLLYYLMLGSLILNRNYYPTGNVSDSHSTTGGINMLSSRSSSPVRIDTQVFITYLHINLQKFLL